MSNTNCLEGLQCPDCTALEPFEIVTRSFTTVTDNGIESTRDHEWDSNSPIRCLRCDAGWREVGDFRIANQREEACSSAS